MDSVYSIFILKGSLVILDDSLETFLISMV